MAVAHYDKLETRDPASRERALLRALREAVEALGRKRARRGQLAGIEAKRLRSRADLAAIPVMRKSELKDRQASDPPFGGLASAGRGVARLFASPGPVYEPEGAGDDWWGVARALHAAGLRRGDVVLNTFSYNLTPGGFIFDSGARALGCPVIPAGPSDKATQLDLIAHFRPSAYAGTPDFLKILLDAWQEAGRGDCPIRKALVSGAALPPSLRESLEGRGVPVRQAYATADLGCIAFETATADGALAPGMVVNEGLILEIVRPGTDEPVPDGEVGEVVVTRLDPVYPLIRFGTGDLSAVLAGPSPCGRTNRRIRGWMGRADQRTKVKGMFVDPAQVDAVVKRHPEILRARLVVGRADEQDTMLLRIESRESAAAFTDAVARSLAEATRLKGRVEVVAPGGLPNDGKVIADER